MALLPRSKWTNRLAWSVWSQRKKNRDRNAALEPSPVITQQPANLTVTEGDPASFTCLATGTGDITYQWYVNSVLAPTETSSTLNIATTVIGDNGATFYCVVTDTTILGSASIQSDTATLTVNPAP